MRGATSWTVSEFLMRKNGGATPGKGEELSKGAEGRAGGGSCTGEPKADVRGKCQMVGGRAHTWTLTGGGGGKAHAGSQALPFPGPG